MSLWSTLGNIGKFAVGFIPGIGGTLSKVLDAAGAATGAASDAMAKNRGANAQFDIGEGQVRNAQQRDHWAALTDYYKTLMDRERANADSRAANMAQLRQAEYIRGRTEDYRHKDPRLMSFGLGPKASTANEIGAATTLRDQLLPRIGTDAIGEIDKPVMGSPFSIDSKYRKPGLWENILNVASPALTTVGKFGVPTPPSVPKPATPDWMEY